MIQDILNKFNHIKDQRTNFEDTWQDMALYCLGKGDFISKITPPDISTKVYDSTARFSSHIFAAGLGAYLTNPSTKWFSLKVQDRNLMESVNVRGWLKECEEIIYSTLNSSNFNEEIYTLYRLAGVLGTGILYEQEDDEDIVRFFNRMPSEIYIAEDARGKVTEVFRFFTFTAKQAYEMFGENAGENIKEALKNNPYKKIEFLHYVSKRDIREAGKRDKYNKPFQSLWINYTQKKLCAEGGYDEFPFFVVRLVKSSPAPYGVSPAMEILPDIKMLNRMKKTILKQAEKMVDPPLDVPDEGYVLPLDMSPGAINYHRMGLGKDDLFRQLTPDISRGLPITIDMIKDTQEVVKQAFFTDLFLMFTSLPKMTATEVAERVNEKMLILSPILGRMMNELLDPIIERAFNILARAGKLPPVPEELQGVSYTVQYVSPLARAQKAYENKSMREFIAAVGELMQIAPQAIDVINTDRVVKEYAETQNIAPDVIRDDAQIQQIREQRAQAMQLQQALELANKGAQTVKTGAEAEKVANG